MATVQLLMIDDHPSQIEGYKSILKYNTSGHAIDTTECYDCKSAYHLITSSPKPKFDLVFLDKNLPGYPEENILSGEDLALLVREHLPGTSLIIITSFTEAFVLYTIMKEIEPEGLMVKSDFRPEELLHAFDIVVNGGTYYTETVRTSFQQLLAKSQYLDDNNRRIIELLSQGVKTKSIPRLLDLSMSAVEKRKAHIRDYFCIKYGSDEDIVREARKLGYI